MRNLARIVVLAGLFVVGARQADAATITLGSIGFGTSPFQGDLAAAEDIALLTFSLTEDTLFDAWTTSFSDTEAFGFDPYFALFRNGSLFERADPSDPTGTFLSVSGDIDLDGGNYDDRLTLTLTAGSYTLALLQYTNELRGNDLLDNDPWLDVAFVGDPSCPFGDFGDGCRTGRFAMNVALTSTGPPPPAPVPEPGTLTLLGIGVAGAALRTIRRRQTRS